MQQTNINILSTRPLDEALVAEAKNKGIIIDEVSFIETEPIQSIEVQQEVEQALLQLTTVVFTSMNAVEAVVTIKNEQQPNWKIYCIGNTTRQLVKKYFGEESIVGTANSATELAERIVEEANTDELIFFCGDQRRAELPDIVRQNEIEVTEIVVYQTIALPQKIKKEYSGILFFSPSAAESFFRSNKINNQTILFAIGNTTAIEIKKYTNNQIIISDEPGKDNLVKQMIKYFGDA